MFSRYARPQLLAGRLFSISQQQRRRELLQYLAAQEEMKRQEVEGDVFKPKTIVPELRQQRKPQPSPLDQLLKKVPVRGLDKKQENEPAARSRARPTSTPRSHPQFDRSSPSVGPPSTRMLAAPVSHAAAPLDAIDPASSSFFTESDIDEEAAALMAQSYNQEADVAHSYQDFFAADIDQKLDREPAQVVVKPSTLSRREIKNSSITAPTSEVLMGDVEFELFDQPPEPKSLSVVILGTPNAGKSVLVNRLVKSKVSAVSPKRNTTRQQALGVVTDPHTQTQLVIYDTPGINAMEHAKMYQKELSTAAWDAAAECDVGLVLMDAAKKIGPAEKELLSKVKELSENSGIKIILALNKVDLVHPKEQLLELADYLVTLADFQEVFYISVTEDEYVGELEDWLYENAVEREWSYDPEMVTDQTDLERVTEIIREKIYLRLNQEIPYAVQQRNVGWTELRDGSLRIDQHLLVQGRVQGMILVGKEGTVLKRIRDSAENEIAKVLGRPVHLFLRVVQEK